MVCSNHPKISEIRAKVSESKNGKQQQSGNGGVKQRGSKKKRLSHEDIEEGAAEVVDTIDNSNLSNDSGAGSSSSNNNTALMCKFITQKPKDNVISEDISLGRERNIKIKCVNEVDNATLPPFTYIASNIQSQGLVERLKLSNFNPDFLVCCDCPEGCDVNPENCACIQMSSGLDLKNKNKPTEGDFVV